MPTDHTAKARAPIVPKLTGQSCTINGVCFECWRVGVNQYEWRGEHCNSKIVVRRNYNSSTYTALVDGLTIGRLYREMRSAMRAAVKYIGG